MAQGEAGGTLGPAEGRTAGLHQEDGQDVWEGKTGRYLLHQDLTMADMVQPTASPLFNQ